MQTRPLLALALPASMIIALASREATGAVLIVAGTPERETAGVVIGQIHPGPQIEFNAGSGFSDTYNVGFGARIGFTTEPGIYLGGNIEHFVVARDIGGSPHNTLLGGEVGLKLFPSYRWELRPYGFAGAEIPSNGGTQLALAPGLVAAYHFGQGFVDIDARYLATPNPTTFMLMGGGGIAF
jgi:hypothetical protein